MRDDTTHQDGFRGKAPPGSFSSIVQSKEAPAQGSEASCAAFGYLRGAEQGASVEFRFTDGTSSWFPYSWLGHWQYHPKEGLLLKFDGDITYLVLIRGRNLEKPLKDGLIDLARAGLQRHRVLWVREMTPEEIQQVGRTEPTISSIEVADFESHAAEKEWLREKVPGFLRGKSIA